MDKKIVVAVLDKNEFGKNMLAGAWKADKPDPERAIAAAAAVRDRPVDKYKEEFSPEVYEFTPAILPELP